MVTDLRLAAGVDQIRNVVMQISAFLGPFRSCVDRFWKLVDDGRATWAIEDARGGGTADYFGMARGCRHMARPIFERDIERAVVAAILERGGVIDKTASLSRRGYF